MWAGTTHGRVLPPTTSYPLFMAGTAFRAWTIAKPMRCVKEILPPRERRRWLLITIRWSISSLTGSERTLVAVETLSERSMFFAVRPGAPRSVVRTGSATATSARSDGLGGSAGTPPRVPGVVGRPSALAVAFSTVGVRRAVVGAIGNGTGPAVLGGRRGPALVTVRGASAGDDAGGVAFPAGGSAGGVGRSVASVRPDPLPADPLPAEP